MNKLYLTLLFIICIAGIANAQTEASIQINSGVSRFTGGGAIKNTFLDGMPNSGYANNPGNSLAATYGFGLQVQHVYKCNFILGVETGFDIFGARTNINEANGTKGSFTNATGHTTTHYYFVNENLYFGYRANLGNLKIDLMPGADIAFGTGSSYKVDVKTDDGAVYNKSGYVQYTPLSQIRARFGLGFSYHRIGFTASYAYGLRNENTNLTYSNVIVPASTAMPGIVYTPYSKPKPLHEELFRLGLSYRITKK